MPKTISDIEERYKERLIASVFQNLNAALPHIERYYDDWNWRNEEVISPAELLNESWEDIFAFLSGEVPQKYSDDNRASRSPFRSFRALIGARFQGRENIWRRLAGRCR